MEKQNNKNNIINQRVWANVLNRWSLFSTYNIPEERAEDFLKAKVNTYFCYCYGMIVNGQENIVKMGLYLSGMRNTVRLDNKYQALLYLVVHCYIYYLAVRESDDCVPADIRQSALNIWDDKAVKGAFLDFLNMLSENSEWLNLDILDQMYGIIDRFELFPQYGAAKSMIIEPVTSDFYLFFILFMSHEFFLPELLERNIDDMRAFRYVSEKNEDKTKGMLGKLFRMIFIGNKSEEQIDKEVDLMYDDLEKMVKKKQKERYIRLAKEAQENYESRINEEEICEKIKDDTIKNIKEKFAPILIESDEKNGIVDVNLLNLIDYTSSSLIVLCLGMLVASLAAASVVKYQITMLQCEAGYYTACGKRIEIAEHMRYLPMGYFNQNSLGQITNITTNTMEQLADVATRVVMMTTGGVLTSSVITVMMLIFDIRIGFIAMVGMVLFFTVNSFLQRKSKALAPVKAAADEFVVEKVLEYVQGISEVRSYNLTGCASKELNEAIDKNRDINTTMELKTVPWMQLQSIILKLMGVAIILTSCGFYLAGSMTLQNCIGMIICSFLVFESLGSAGNYSTLLRIVDLSVSKVENVMRIKEMDTDGKNIIPKNFDIEVENVDFYYDENHAEDAKIINHLSVHIPERTTTAIVGPSGGGKTTLCHLISRFWDVSNGNISLGGENVRNYSVDSLMKNFSFVFQNVYLFEDTIANNIRFGQPEASMKLVMDAAKKACCHDFIMELPNGYDTVIGEGGTSLSGGEKQRISIARAIMKDAPVIILDEATANVDPENEKELMSAIEALTKEKTIIMIAHRLKTVEHADQILVLDKGQIVQQGRHSELLKQTGIYRKFILEREEAVGWKI